MLLVNLAPVGMGSDNTLKKKKHQDHHINWISSTTKLPKNPKQNLSIPFSPQRKRRCQKVGVVVLGCFFGRFFLTSSSLPLKARQPFTGEGTVLPKHSESTGTLRQHSSFKLVTEANTLGGPGSRHPRDTLKWHEPLSRSLVGLIIGILKLNESMKESPKITG